MARFPVAYLRPDAIESHQFVKSLVSTLAPALGITSIGMLHATIPRTTGLPKVTAPCPISERLIGVGG